MSASAALNFASGIGAYTPASRGRRATFSDLLLDLLVGFFEALLFLHQQMVTPSVLWETCFLWLTVSWSVCHVFCSIE